MLKTLFAAGMAALAMAGTAHAEAPLPAQLTVTHIALDKWRVEYRFSQPVTALKFEPVGDYRKIAWKVLTPGVTLASSAGAETLAAAGKPLRRISLEITTFDQIVPKAYLAMDRFSDGGRALYLGFLEGDAMQGAVERSVAPSYTLKGMGQESVLAPPPVSDPTRNASAYAYFGPRAPVVTGDARMIVDAKLPAWVADALLDTTAKVAAYYGNAYGQKLRQPLLLLVSADDLESPGLSVKGGAVGGQIEYRFGGKALLTESPKKRQMITQLIAHEMAHLWQNNVTRGGIGEQAPPWVHEGGAEAMALDGLLGSGVWSAEQGQSYVDATLKECETLGHSYDSYRGIYACGFERYHRLQVGTAPLWRAMMAAADTEGATYTEDMVDALAAKARQSAP